MEDLKGASAVHFNFPLQSFALYITFKDGIAAAGELIPSFVLPSHTIVFENEPVGGGRVS